MRVGKLILLGAEIARLHGEAARRFGDSGRLHYARIGRMPAGAEIAPHANGYDGVRQRRYQIILQSGPDADMVFAAERRCMRPLGPALRYS